jgi:hypothetical protein
MNASFDQNTVRAIRDLYKTDDTARRLFDRWAERERDATATTIDRLHHLLGISREEAVRLAQRLEQAGCGQFIVGRRGHKSRFAWAYSCVSLGQVAAGETSELEEPEDPLPEAEEEKGAIGGASSLPHMNITEAKRALSASLGVPESAIEILIRA